MTDPLFLADLTGVTTGSVVCLDGAEGHHAAVARRIQLGESVLLGDGQGAGVRGQVVEATRSGLKVLVDEVLSPRVQPLVVVAIQALAKGERSEIAVEALTELGAAEILAWSAARSVVRWDTKMDKGLAKWRSAAVAATKQSRRLRIPGVGFADTAEVARRIAGADLALVLHEDATVALREVTLPSRGECVIVAGPEGGISPDELERFRAAGALPVSVSDAVLRTSTAGLVALAQIRALQPEDPLL
ncbi:16S rRNA (uracil1498-N3)-methyltransferase [Propionibacterium cyclohexanicum]|uniref:Ribosomal RNA small subunit methyltransferase E n=1 Tax=Propionibacterium cyclohexanicum TaxID=64702 RepID=A0A1H9Q8W2_9ACTN|nr:16S rRNA (uracil(1498)-N(3))-methyltransferase [Propionibacterium cyclohexanicum]SER56293.1 16S rRNA (uracil1498-N3)-methyltransferase [Propionibacterium cyclohexanicum]